MAEGNDQTTLPVDTEAASGPPPPYQANYGGTTEISPPEYTDAPNQNDMPPSYESLFGQMQAAKQESSGMADFFKKFTVILCGTLGCTICIGIVLVIPIAMIVIGAVYKDDCPVEPYIPIYLIVGGSVGVLKNIISVFQRCKNKQENRSEENHKANPLDGILSCFLVVWFIAGNIWIYRTHNEFNTDPDSKKFCDPTLYWFAFWLTTSMYIIMASVCFCICCAGMLAAAAGDNQQRQSGP